MGTDELIELCRGALATPSCSFPSVSDWARLYDLVARNGVTALTYNAVQNAPLPRQLAITWALSTECIEARYRKQYQTSQHLSEFYREQGIRMLILKGIGLSRYYPRPETRECGDIDIYLFDDYERGNELVNTEIHYHHKHAVFTFEGTLIENHYEFVTTEWQKHNVQADKDLRYLIDKYGVVEDRGFLFPSAEFDMLFVLRHAANHIENGIPLRQVIDWALLLRAEREKLDDEIRQIIARNRLARLFDAMTLVAIRLTGEDFSDLLFNPRRAKRDAKLLLKLVEGKKRDTSKRTLIGKIIRTLSYYRRYRLVPDSFYGILWLRTREYRKSHTKS